jgi:uncharacterized protein YndB with AHSA1/START domain
MQGGGAHTIHSRLRLAVPPHGVLDALMDIAPRHRWFLRHAQQLGAVEPPAEYGLRGGYHFWSHFAPDPPPTLTTTLVALDMPKAHDPGARMRYVWNHRGRSTEVDIELAPSGDGTLLHLAHHGLEPLAADPLGGAAYWTIVLENMRLYLQGHDGLAFHYARSRGALELGLLLQSQSGDTLEQAWEMLTTPRQLDSFWAQGARIDPRVGGQLSYGWPQGGPGEIVAFEPPRRGVDSARLASTWQLAGDPLPTIVTWNLSGTGAATRLTIVHSGFGDAANATPYADTWRAMLGQLRERLDDEEEWETE